MAARNILVLYAVRQYPIRGTLRDHLYSFRRHSDARCHYVNLGVRRLPRRLGRIPFDLIVFHNSVLSLVRWDPDTGERVLSRAQPVKGWPGMRVAMPQDEFLRSAAVNQVIEDFRIEHVFSVAPESEWDAIYDGVDRRRVGFTNVLTGYLDDATVGAIDEIVARTPERPIDIGYRARHAAMWLGAHGQLKTQIAGVFQRAGAARGLTVDISTREQDTLFGDAWLHFMAQSKYTIGVEGGASVLDRDGQVRVLVEQFLRERPDASYDEVEAACFPGRDGEIALYALSPRHLEACAARTCQILVEGSYNGVLEAGRHYIPVRRDFSNLDEVLDLVQSDTVRQQITDAAYRDIVQSRRYTYRQLVATVESVLPPASGVAAATGRASAVLSDFADRASWALVYFHARIAPRLDRWRYRLIGLAVRAVPVRIRRALRRS